jgi:hypothetical protein
VNDLFRRAESILAVASANGATSGGTGIVLDRAGQLRVLSLDGWSLTGLIQEFGAREIYIIKQCAGTTSVEGWSATESCTISQKNARKSQADMIPTEASPGTRYAARLQLTPQLAS